MNARTDQVTCWQEGIVQLAICMQSALAIGDDQGSLITYRYIGSLHTAGAGSCICRHPAGVWQRRTV